MKSENYFETRKTVIIGLLTAVLILMALTPLGYLNIGPLSITFNMIPVAIGTVAAGKKGGTILGGVFGLTSFLSCMGIIVPLQPFGAALLEINWFFTFILCFGTRILTGFILGVLSESVFNKISGNVLKYSLFGFFAAFFNTLFFMTALVLLFGKTEYIQSIWQSMANGKNVIFFICAFVGVNFVAEIISSTILTSIISCGLSKAKLIK